MNHTEKKLSGEQVFSGILIRVEQDRVELENGAQAMREVVRHRGAVAVLALEKEKILLVRQYRYPIGREMLEIPAGKLEAGEEPYPAAMRELSEETGCTCEELLPLGDYYGSAGFCDEKLRLYFARVEQTGAQHPDADEFLSVERYTVAQMREKIARGEIADGKTLSAFALADSRGLLKPAE